MFLTAYNLSENIIQLSPRQRLGYQQDQHLLTC